jgi:hypothetical protein
MPEQSPTLRQVLDRIFDGEVEQQIAAALCVLDENDPNGLSCLAGEKTLHRTWELYRADAQKLLQPPTIAGLVESGWIVCPPGHIPLPRSKLEAESMILVAERCLKDYR